jgi:hypothetical protein
MRERARNIREAARDFSDEVSRTLVEMADDLEAEATKLESQSAAETKPATE